MITRESLFTQVLADYAGTEGTPTLELPLGESPIADTIEKVGDIYNYGIRWKDNPSILNITTYGPLPIFDKHRVVAYDATQYCCYAD